MSAANRLTHRERQVLALVLRGLGNKQIAAELGVTEPAIKEHVSALLAKFAVPNRAALAEAGTRLELMGGRGVDSVWLRQLFREAEPQICVLRGPDLRYEAVNDAFVRAAGGRAMVGRTMREAWPELEGQGILESVERVYATGEPLLEHEVTRHWDRGRGIERRLVDLVVQPLHADDGSVNGIIAYALDVTDLVSARRMSEVSEELATVVDLVPQGVLIVDEDCRVMKWNRRAAKMLPVLDAAAAADDEEALLLAGSNGRQLTIADVVSTPPTRTRSFTLGAGEGPAFTATVRALREPEGDIRGAILILRRPRSASRSR